MNKQNKTSALKEEILKEVFNSIGFVSSEIRKAVDIAIRRTKEQK